MIDRCKTLLVKLFAKESKTLKKQHIILVASLLLSACSAPYSTNLVMNKFGIEEKTVTISRGADPLLMGIKEIFLENQWTLSTRDSEVDNIAFSDVSTRYLLITDYIEGSDILFGDFVREYCFTLYDVKSEEEVFICCGEKRTLESVLSDLSRIISNNES